MSSGVSRPVEKAVAMPDGGARHAACHAFQAALRPFCRCCLFESGKGTGFGRQLVDSPAWQSRQLGTAGFAYPPVLPTGPLCTCRDGGGYANDVSTIGLEIDA